MSLLFDRPLERSREDIVPGAIWLRGFLSATEQRQLAETSQALLDGPAGGYVPTVRGGGRMHVRMVCIGRHWNAMTYRYEPTRGDYDDEPVAPMPGSWVQLAQRAAAESGFSFTPDIGIVNAYGAEGRMGLHQDKSESGRTLASGAPVVSFSIGDTGRFLFGGSSRRDPVRTLMLESGDAFVFGGPARLCYHGISRILPSTAPGGLALSGRLNVTFRQY